MSTHRPPDAVIGRSPRMLLAAAILACGITACTTTQQVRVGTEHEQRACAFLGDRVCAQLTARDVPGPFSSSAITGAGQSAPSLRYVAPNAQWTRYRKIMLSPVSFWAGDNVGMSPADQQALTDYFDQALRQQLATKFQLVTAPGRDVLTVQVAIIDAESATPILRTISMLVPQARALAMLKYAATGTYAFVGSATAEVKILDSLTHDVLAAAVDRRVGGGSLATAAQWRLGDAENATTAWSQELTSRLSSLTSGGSPS